MEKKLNSEAGNQENEEELTFNRYYFRESKSFLFFIGLAMLYCVAYGVILIQEFSRMGIISMVLNIK